MDFRSGFGARMYNEVTFLVGLCNLSEMMFVLAFYFNRKLSPISGNWNT